MTETKSICVKLTLCFVVFAMCSGQAMCLNSGQTFFQTHWQHMAIHDNNMVSGTTNGTCFIPTFRPQIITTNALL